MNKYKFVGCFLDPKELWEKTESIRSQRLEIPVEKPHVTFLYRPEKVDENLFGIRMKIVIEGYGCDGNNEGLLVRVMCGRKELAGLITAIQVPHITLSVSEGAEAVNTKNLHFEPVAPIILQGTFGAVTLDGKEVVLKKPFHQEGLCT